VVAMNIPPVFMVPPPLIDQTQSVGCGLNTPPNWSCKVALKVWEEP